MCFAIGDVMWLRRDSGLAGLHGRVGTNPGRVGDAWADEDGEHISVIYEDEQILALNVAAAEFVRAAAAVDPAEPGGHQMTSPRPSWFAPGTDRSLDGLLNEALGRWHEELKRLGLTDTRAS